MTSISVSKRFIQDDMQTLNDFYYAGCLNIDSATSGRSWVLNKTLLARITMHVENGTWDTSWAGVRFVFVKRPTNVNGTAIDPDNFFVFGAGPDINTPVSFPPPANATNSTILWDVTLPVSAERNGAASWTFYQSNEVDLDDMLGDTSLGTTDTIADVASGAVDLLISRTERGLNALPTFEVETQVQVCV